MRSFDELVAEAEAAPITGWDFSWLDGRATEERPRWHYAEQVAARAANVTSMLDLQSGGGELLSTLRSLPPLMVASEGYAPNVTVAGRNLQPRGALVVAAHDDRSALPFADATFELVTSRHPIATYWDEIARVLQPGATYFSQQVGPHTMREVSEFFLGPLPETSKRDPALARQAAEDAGLAVAQLEEARLLATFDDVGAVVYFLRLVVWTVPNFSVERYRARLRDLHEQIARAGPFVAHATRFLIEATKP
jgi:SAM-dependent methyltransferase